METKAITDNGSYSLLVWAVIHLCFKSIDFGSFYLLVQTNPINLIINKSDEMQIHE
jgi:hypothetical protein